MKLKWLGHSCFLITAQDGRTLLTDPFDETVGYPVPGVPANVVTCSHRHSDHHATQSLPTGYAIVDQPGVHHVHGFVVEGILVFHDDKLGTLRGRNLIYAFEIDGLRVAHLGDLGHLLSEEQLEALGRVDVLLIPVGGTFTIDARGAAETVRMIKPRLTIPMHYKTPSVNFDLADERAFVEEFDHQYLGGNVLELTAESLSALPPVLVMDYRDAQ